MMSEARAASVRGPRQVTQIPPASSTTAAGSSQEISSPNSPFSSRCTPAVPPKLLPDAPPPPEAPAGRAPAAAHVAAPAEQPPAPVVPERELRRVVVGRPADVGPVGG